MTQENFEGFEVDELDDEMLEDVAGGKEGTNIICPNKNCGDACSPSEEEPSTA